MDQESLDYISGYLITDSDNIFTDVKPISWSSSAMFCLLNRC